MGERVAQAKYAVVCPGEVIATWTSTEDEAREYAERCDREHDEAMCGTDSHEVLTYARVGTPVMPRAGCVCHEAPDAWRQCPVPEHDHTKWTEHGRNCPPTCDLAPRDEVGENAR